jgi:glutathione S-transferase
MPNSPFARKVVAVARETGQADKIELIETQVVPISPNSMITALNPMTRVPVLTFPDGRQMVDSRVICEFLDSQHYGPKMFPDEPMARFVRLQEQALADGIIEAISIVIYEYFVRPEELTWKAWQRAHINKARRTVVHFDQSAEDLAGRVDIGTISIACSLAVIDYTCPDVDWRGEAPNLATWYDDFSQRPSLTPL